MNYLLDTNILSETLKPVPNPQVMEWFKAVPSESLFVSVLSFGEIRKGIEKLSLGKRKTQLVLWLEHELPAWFDARVLAVTHTIADRWGYLVARPHQTVSVIDGLLAATALTHNLIMVTRNTKDFDWAALEVLNPFEE